MNSTVIDPVPLSWSARQPGDYFRQHPWQYRLAVTAATATAVTGAWRAAQSTGWRRVRYAMLAGVETIVVLGIIDATTGLVSARCRLVRPLD